mgnify:CR=1 FL=1|jgi:peptide/nickel transport system ATP-binding protein
MVNMHRESKQPLLQIKDLKTYFFTHEGVVKAVNGVSLGVNRGKVLGIVGESGCGKSVLSRSIMGIVGSRGRIVEGEILYYPQESSSPIDLAKLKSDGKEIRSIRGREISMIFQEPMSSFSPVHTIGNQIMEAIQLHRQVGKSEARSITIELLGQVGIHRPVERIDEYPHQMSGGMLQRAMIAMALACQPQLLIADEPTTALDVTIQAQILELIQNLQRDMRMSMIIITHDLGVIAEMADDICVMYLGKVVESGTAQDIFDNPQHPYTRALLDCIPKLDSLERTKLFAIQGTVPDAYNIPPGCSFYQRCPVRIKGKCNVFDPESVEVGPDHRVRCFLYDGREVDGLRHHISSQ